MKRVIAILVVALMALSLVVPAFAYTPGKAGRIAKNNQVEVVKRDSTIVIDGVITEEEWGLPVKTFRVSDAIDGRNSMSPSDDALFYFTQLANYEISDDTYTVYMRWDESYLYIAVIMEDADGDEEGMSGYRTAADEQSWKNDTQQFMIEPGVANQGENSYKPFKTKRGTNGNPGLGGSVWFAYTRTWNDDTQEYDPVSGNVFNDDPCPVIDATSYGNQVAIEIDENNNKKYYYEYALSLQFLNLYTGPKSSDKGKLQDGASWAISIAFVNNNATDSFTGGSDGFYHQYTSWGAGAIPVPSDDVTYLSKTTSGNIQLNLVNEPTTPVIVPECTHPSTHLDYTNAIEAKCCEDGLEPDVVCDICGEIVQYGRVIDHHSIPHQYGEDDICHVLKEDGTECGAVLCHHYETEVLDAVEPTCQSTGYSGDVYCVDCHELLDMGQDLDIVDHVYVGGYCKWCGTPAPVINGEGVSVTGNVGTGVTIESTPFANDSPEFVLVNGKLPDAKAFFVYNIELLDANRVAVQPTGLITVTLNIPEELLSAEGTDYKVYYLNPETNELVDMYAVVVDGNKVEFDIDHLSNYVLAKVGTTTPPTTEVPPTTPTTPTTEVPPTTEPTKPDQEKPSEPSSNIGLIIGIVAAVVVVVVVVVIIVSKKKK